MKFPRASGILLHPTSLPGRYGIGDFGPEAYRFAEFLAAAGQKLWQVLPLVPTGYGESPYASLSSFAGNPLLISPEKLVEHGFLSANEIADPPGFPQDRCDFERAIPYRYQLLDRAFTRFKPTADYAGFVLKNRSWLEGCANFLALKNANGGVAWTEWRIDQADPGEIEKQKFWQFEFYRQWAELKAYCGARGIRVFGDIPIYVAHDSADVWANPELFELDAKGRPIDVAGVPPDYFSATGQLWGNPIYRWDRMAQDGYAWWVERFKKTLEVVDLVRVDHFRGFEAYWSVPASETTAVNGKWIKGPGAALFRAVQQALGDLPIVAENLGVITAEVEGIRHEFGFPGMSILQFAFGNDAQAPTFRPHNYPREVVAYSGTHDNETTVGWWTGSGAGNSTRTKKDVEVERAFARAYLNARPEEEIQWAFIRALMASVADTVIVPLQDVLGLGNEARMNLPASASGNWRWRFLPGALRDEHRDRLRELTVLFER
jgi:4-alpha-glucanotransferase